MAPEPTSKPEARPPFDPKLMVLFAAGVALGSAVTMLLDNLLRPPCPCKEEAADARPSRRGLRRPVPRLAQDVRYVPGYGPGVVSGVGDGAGDPVASAGAVFSPYSPVAAPEGAGAGDSVNGVGDLSGAVVDGGGEG